MDFNRHLLMVVFGIGLCGMGVVLADPRGQQSVPDAATIDETAVAATDNAGVAEVPVMQPVRYGKGYEARADCPELRGKGSADPKRR